MAISELKKQNVEIEQMLEDIFVKYGYDFRNYAKASLERRVMHRIEMSGLKGVSELHSRILKDKSFFDIFLKDMSITVTEMFRDPSVFAKIKELIIPYLATYPRINIWHAGCATGEEVYSMAILLHESNLLKRVQLYATDYNNKSLNIAKEGIYPIENMGKFSKNYYQSGGSNSFSDYYQAKYNSVIFKSFLKEKILFANHNLMMDQSFAEMNLILCRNVLIYFDKFLQNKVLELFRQSLVHRGFLVLGNKETLAFSSIEKDFDKIASKERIYRKKLLNV